MKKAVIAGILILALGLVVSGISFALMGFSFNSFAKEKYESVTTEIGTEFTAIDIRGNTENIRLCRIDQNFPETRTPRVVCSENSWLKHTVLDIIQPDLSHAGGILEVRKIAAMAEAYDMAVAPHCPLGPVALAACLQLDACTPNAFIQEQSLGIHYNRGSDLLDYIKNPGVFEYKDGKVKIPSAPGLGVEVNEELLIEKTREHGWKNPVWRNHDGTVAEW